MRQQIKSVAERTVSRTVTWSQRHCGTVLAIALIASGLAAAYSASNISINTNTEEMLSERLPWRIAYTDFKQAFPFFSDTIVIVVDGATADLAVEAATQLTRELERNTTDFAEVFNPAASEFFRFNQLLYADQSELDELVDQLSGAQALLGRLTADPGLAGLLTLIRDLVAEQGPDLPVEAAGLLRSARRAIDELRAGDYVPMSWQALLTGEATGTAKRVVFSVDPRLDFTSILPAENAMLALRSAIAALGYDEHDGVKIRLTGEAALAHDELKSVIRGAEQAGLLAMAMIAACLTIGLRSFSLVVATLLTLTVGLIFTATFAVVAVGTLNMISIAFAVLYVGLGVDFAIHLSLRYRELCGEQGKFTALTHAANHLGGSLVLCALTTAIAFFAFIPTAYRGVAELGLIAGVGMFIGLVTSFTVLPALLQSLPAPRMKTPPRGTAILAAEPGHAWHTRPIIALAALSTIAACFALPLTTFDLNPLHLNDPHAESVTTIADLASNADQPLYTISLVVPDADAVATMTTRLEELTTVAEVMSSTDLVPENQETKLATIEDLRWTLGGDLELQAAAPVDRDAITVLIDAINDGTGLPGAPGEFQSALAELRASLAALQADLDELDTGPARALLAGLETKLMHHFAGQIERLGDALNAGSIDSETLPRSLSRRWRAQDGRYRLEIRPQTKLEDNLELTEFVDSVRAITGPRATGTPVINIEASRAVTMAFFQAFGSALVLITALLWLTIGRPAEVVVVLLPLMLAGLLTTALNVVFGIPFNFANIIALPLLMGIGVDSALHMLHRYKTSGPGAPSLLRTSTARAILFSALTTTASFGNLAVSPHAGTASMGVMLSVGLAMTLICTLVVMPALLRHFVKPAVVQM